MHEYKRNLEIQSLSVKEGLVTAILSTPDVDCYNDVVLPSAIETKALVGMDVKLEHDLWATVGYVTNAWEDGSSKVIECKLVPESKYYQKTIDNLESGKYKGVSFGYYAADYAIEGKTRVLKKINVKEVTITANPANKKARIMSFKSINSFDGFPIAALDTTWDASKADMNIRQFLGAQNAPNEEYAKCFLWFDKYAAEHFTSYKLQIIDVIDGKLQIVPKAVKSAMDTSWSFIPYEETEQLRDNLESLDRRIEDIRVEKKHEIKSMLKKLETSNQIMKLWRESDNSGLQSNDMRESLFDAVNRIISKDLTNTKIQEQKNSYPSNGVHTKDAKSKVDLQESKSIPHNEEISHVSTEDKVIVDKNSVKQFIYSIL